MVGSIDTSRIIPDLLGSGAAIILDKGLRMGSGEIWLAAMYVVTRILYRMFDDTIKSFTGGMSSDYQAVFQFAVNIIVTGVAWHYLVAYFTSASLPIPEAILLSGFAIPTSMLVKPM